MACPIGDSAVTWHCPLGCHQVSRVSAPFLCCFPPKKDATALGSLGGSSLNALSQTITLSLWKLAPGHWVWPNQPQGCLSLSST